MGAGFFFLQQKGSDVKEMDNWEEVQVRYCHHGTIVTGPWASLMWWHPAPGSKTWCDDMAPTAILSQPAVSERRKPRSIETMLRESASRRRVDPLPATEGACDSRSVDRFNNPIQCACAKGHVECHQAQSWGLIYKW